MFHIKFSVVVYSSITYEPDCQVSQTAVCPDVFILLLSCAPQPPSQKVCAALKERVDDVE